MTAILHVVSGLGMGGAERNLVQVTCALQRRGLTQHVVRVGAGDVWSEILQAEGVGVTTLGVGGMLSAPAGLLRLSHLIRAAKPKIVQGWMYHGDLFATLAHGLTPGRKTRRLFWNLRASDTDQGRYGSIVAVNARLSSWPDAIIANSQNGLDFHRARGYRARYAEVIPNGIDTEKFKPDAKVRAEVRAELGLAPQAVIVVHVARNDPMKDHATFLSAMNALPQLQGLLVGMGTEALPLPPNVRSLGLRRDVKRIYAAGDIAVSSSAFAEGFSNAIAEGMSAGLVAVATDVGDARLVVGDTGDVLPPRQPEAMAAALAKVAALEPDERLARGSRARQRIVQQFGLTRAVDRYEQLYASLADAD